MRRLPAGVLEGVHLAMQHDAATLHPPVVAAADDGSKSSPKYIAQYWEHARLVPQFFVCGELDGDRMALNANSFDRYLSRTGIDTVIVEYRGRGHEHFHDEILRQHVRGLVYGSAAHGLALFHEVAGDLGLAIDRHLPAGQPAKVDAVVGAVEGERDAVVAQALGIEPGGRPAFLEQGDRALLEQPGAHPFQDVALAGAVELRVRNPSNELAPADLERIFARFVQRDGSYSRRYGGVGLGLNLVRALAELHGGCAFAELPGHGQVEFVVQLPLHA